MEENRRFRNHFSIVFERLGTGFIAFAMIFLYEGAELLGEIGAVIRDIENMKVELISILLIGLCLLVLFSLVVGLQIFRWAKTYISIQEQAIVIEVNTLKRRKNTIGIKNISNINIEQNLFERLLGTAKVKMDTNSMSTADETDVKIVLKKQDAEMFRTKILEMIEGGRYAQGNYDKQQEYKENTDIAYEKLKDIPGAGIEEMLIQGVFSMKLISIPLLILSMIGVTVTIAEALQEGAFTEGVLGMLSSILIIAVFGMSILWDIVKKFVQYYGFRIQRLNDRLHISYGLIKKVSYTIPVDKISAVKLVQSPQARIVGRYMAELINVGMGDDVENEKSFFLLYDTKNGIQEKIADLLPEFANDLSEEVHKQSAKVWLVWLVPSIIYLMTMSVVVLGLCEFLEAPINEALIFAGGITVLVLIRLVGIYLTRGYFVGEESLQIVTGTFARKIILVKYPQIQYIETKQNFIAKRLHLQKGTIYLLASTINRVQEIPYFPEEETEKIKEYLLHS